MDLNLKAGIIKNSDGENISPVTSSDTVYIKDTTLTEKFNNIIGREYTGSTNGEIFNDYENNIASGIYSHAEGYHTTASGAYSHAEGSNTTASGAYSHAEGSNTTASGIYSHSEGLYSTASGSYSHSEGLYSTASASYSYAEGVNATANGSSSHAEGYHTTASGAYSHAEGCFTTASGIGSHAGGYSSYAGGNYGSFAHGSGCIADSQETVLFVSGYSGSTIDIDTSGEKLSTSKTSTILSKFKINQEILLLNKSNPNKIIINKKIVKSINIEDSSITVDGDLPLNFDCHCIINPSIRNVSIMTYPNIALGVGCVSLGIYTSSAIGYYVTASGYYSHAEGANTIANGSSSHAEGTNTIASNSHSHAEGYHTTASGNYTHSGGYYTNSDKTYMTAIGKYNKTGVDSYFSIGKGSSSSSRANAFRVSSTGSVYGSSAYNSSGADYAEYMEWLDDNINKEDRTGLFVEVKQGKIQIANSYSRRLAGVISSTPSIVGNSYDDQWHGMYLKDEWDRIVYHDVTIPAEYQEIEHIDEETQEVTIEKILITEERIERQPIVNPEYDHTLEYIGRSERPEYGCVGMKGQLLVKSDGTCEVDDFCIPTTGGIATKSEDESIGYLVLEVRENNIIKILL